MSPDQDGLQSLARTLWTRSSVYAVAQLVASKGCGRRILWLLVLIFGASGCALEVYRFLNIYFQYPVVITLQVENNWKLTFPAVTICNLNRMDATYSHCLAGLPADMIPTCLQNPKESAKWSPQTERQNYATCSQHFDGFHDEEYARTLRFLEKYLKMPVETRKEIGIQVEDLITSCSFNGESCSTSNFSDHLSTQFGNCFTFNGKSTLEEDPIQARYIGSNSGLEVTLELNSSSYLDFTSGIGARVVIHDQNSQPNPEDYGINISPGFETSVAIRQTAVHRLPSPYRDKCERYGIENEAGNQEDCMQRCLQELNLQKCECMDPFLPVWDQLKMCDLKNKSQVCCLDAVMKFLDLNNDTCLCPLPCESTQYELTIFTAEWPTNGYYDKVSSPAVCEKHHEGNHRN